MPPHNQHPDPFTTTRRPASHASQAQPTDAARRNPNLFAPSLSRRAAAAQPSSSSSTARTALANPPRLRARAPASAAASPVLEDSDSGADDSLLGTNYAAASRGHRVERDASRLGNATSLASAAPRRRGRAGSPAAHPARPQPHAQHASTRGTYDEPGPGTENVYGADAGSDTDDDEAMFSTRTTTTGTNNNNVTNNNMNGMTQTGPVYRDARSGFLQIDTLPSPAEQVSGIEAERCEEDARLSDVASTFFARLGGAGAGPGSSARRSKGRKGGGGNTSGLGLGIASGEEVDAEFERGRADVMARLKEVVSEKLVEERWRFERSDCMEALSVANHGRL